MVKLARSELPVLPGDLDADPWLLCTNGTRGLESRTRWARRNYGQPLVIAPVSH